MKKPLLIGCGVVVVLVLALAAVFSERVARLFAMANVDPSGDTEVKRVDAGGAVALPVFVDPRDGGR